MRKQEGFTWCNPAFSDGTGLLTTQEYIDTCPELWQASLHAMKRELDDELGAENWGISQIKEKFWQARIYLWCAEIGDRRVHEVAARYERIINELDPDLYSVLYEGD